MRPGNSCRVRRVNPLTSDDFGEHLQAGHHMSTPYADKGQIYHEHGMIVTQFDQGLLPWQQPRSVRPEYYNQGCARMHARSSQDAHNTTSAVQSEASIEAMRYLFASTEPHTGNSAPPACFTGSCYGADTTKGMEAVEGGRLRFETMYE